MAKSRRKTLEKMERIDKPMMDAKSANIQFGFDRNTGNDVMHIRNLEVGYQSPITAPINIEVTKGELLLDLMELERLHLSKQLQIVKKH